MYELSIHTREAKQATWKFVFHPAVGFYPSAQPQFSAKKPDWDRIGIREEDLNA